MPFYEYQCAACGHHHEELQKVSDRPLRKCPACGRTTLRRLVSAPVFRLKGGGWYETDFKSDQEGKRNLAGAEEAPPADDAGKGKADTKAEPKSEVKPETKPEPKVAASKPAGKGKASAARPKNKAKAKPAKKKSRR